MAPHVVFFSFDSLGDLTLRQPLFKAVLDRRCRVTVAVRSGHEQLIPHLDPRLGVLVTDVNPYVRPDDTTLGRAEELRSEVAAAGPTTLVWPAYNRTYLDDWLVSHFPNVRRVGFFGAGLSPCYEKYLRQLDGSGQSRADDGTESIACREDDHETHKFNLLVKALCTRKLARYWPALTVGRDVQSRADDVLKSLGLEHGRYVIGSPAGTASIQLKAWPRASYVDHVQHLRERYGLTVLLIGIASETPLLEAVAASAASRGIRSELWIGTADELGVLLGLIRRSRLYLGTDSGPMHFAAALGVPIVAQFGGGTWPRFLPVARRSFVATQKLPCFGCHWQCWLSEPCCISEVDPNVVRAGIDWALSDAPDDRRVDAGARLDEPLDRVFRTAMSSRQVVDELRAQLRESDADRTARLEMIREMNSRLADLESRLSAATEAQKELAARRQESEADRAAGLELVNDLDRRLRESEADRAARLDLSNELNRRLQESEADRAARLNLINELSRRLQDSENERASQVQAIRDMGRRLDELEAVGADRERKIEQLVRAREDSEVRCTRQLESVQHLEQLRQDLERRLQGLTTQLESQQQTLDRVLIRFLRRLRVV